MTVASYIQAMPKVELNVHLEGAMRRETVLMIADQNEIREKLKHFNDWIGLLDKPDYKRLNEIVRMAASWLQQPEDLTRTVYDLGVALSKQNVRYAEVSVNPAAYTSLPLSFEDFMTAINDGRDRAKRAWGINMAWVLTIPRDEPRRADDYARWVTTAAARKSGVVGLGLSGREDTQPIGQFERAFRTAEKKLISRQVRAAGIQGADSILKTIETVEPNRILDVWGAVDAPQVLDVLAEKQITVCVNLTRAQKHGWVQQIADYPLRRLYENVLLTLGSDMPLLYRATLTDQYLAAVNEAGLTVEEVEEVALNAVRGSFMSDDAKTTMLDVFRSEYAQLRAEHLAQPA